MKIVTARPGAGAPDRDPLAGPSRCRWTGSSRPSPTRARWLPGVEIRVRTATAPKSYRADWADGTTRIVVGFVPEGDAKAQVGVAHEKLADAGAAAELKAYWRERLIALKALLEA